MLSSKTHIPEEGERIVQRERLSVQVSNVLTKAHLWIGAPAGAGKTILAANFASNAFMPVFWYEFDPLDGDLASFFSTFPQAFSHSLTPSPSFSSLPKFLPEDMLALPIFGHKYFRKLFEQLPERWLLILDNCQVIPDDSPLFKLISICLKELPFNCRTILLSRLPPPQDFANLKIKGLLQVLDGDSLCFTRQEIGQVMAIHGINQKEEESCVDYLQQTTKGWAAGLTLLLKEQNRDICRQVSDERLDHQELFDYFTGVIFRGLPKEEQKLLMVASLMPDIRPDVLDVLLSRVACRDYFQQLGRNNFFTYAHDNSGELFKFHPLFKEFLRIKANNLLPSSELSGYLEQGAAILIAEERIGEGIELLHHAGKYQKVVALIHETGASMLEQGRFQTILHWLQPLPRDMVDHDPWLLFFFGSATMQLTPVDAIDVLKQSFTLFKNQGNTDGAIFSGASLISSIVSYLSDLSALDPVLDFMEQQVEPHIFPTDGSSADINILNAILRGLVVRRPTHPDLEEWLKLTVKQGGLNAAVILHYLWTGRFIKARAALDHISVYKDQIRSKLQLSAITAMEVQYYLIMDDPANCCRVVDEASCKMKKTGIRVWELHLYILGACCCINNGKVKKAAHYLEKVEKKIDHLRLLDHSYYHVVKTLEALLAGDLRAAESHQQLALEMSVTIGMPSYETWCWYGAALVAVFQDNYQIACARFDRVFELATSPGNPWFTCQAHLGLAYMYSRKGEKQQAVEHLRQGFVLAHRKNYLNFIFFIPEMMETLAVMALEEGIETDFVRRFIRRRQLFPQPPPTHLTSWPWPLKIYTLGQLEIYCQGELLTLSAKGPRKPLELLKFLICTQGQKIARETVADRLWSDSDGDRSIQSLNTTLHRLRKLLGFDHAVIMKTGQIFLNTDFCWVDSWHFDGLIQQVGATEDPVLAVNLTQKALSLYGGTFDLNQSNNSVLIGYSEQLKDKWVVLVVNYGKQLVKMGRTDEALDMLQQALTLGDPVEQIYHVMMTILYDQQRMKDVIAVFKRCRRALAERGTLPGDEIRSLYDECIRY